MLESMKWVMSVKVGWLEGDDFLEHPTPTRLLPALTEAATALSNREKEEEHYLSLPLDPSDPKSILYHAKAVYLTLDYNNTRRILDILAHHLLIDEEMLRAKVFGYAIPYYGQRNFPPALERLDELEKLALEHHSVGDVSLLQVCGDDEGRNCQMEQLMEVEAAYRGMRTGM